LRNIDVWFQVWLERIAAIGLLDLRFNQLEDAESESRAQNEQRAPCQQAQEREFGDQDQSGQAGDQSDGAVFRVSP
jgi:hypothetical protein